MPVQAAGNGLPLTTRKEETTKMQTRRRVGIAIQKTVIPKTVMTMMMMVPNPGEELLLRLRLATDQTNDGGRMMVMTTQKPRQ